MPESMQLLFSEICFYFFTGGLAQDRRYHQSGSNQTRQANGPLLLIDQADAGHWLPWLRLGRSAEELESASGGIRHAMPAVSSDPSRTGSTVGSSAIPPCREIGSMIRIPSQASP